MCVNLFFIRLLHFSLFFWLFFFHHILPSHSFTTNLSLPSFVCLFLSFSLSLSLFLSFFLYSSLSLFLHVSCSFNLFVCLYLSFIAYLILSLSLFLRLFSSFFLSLSLSFYIHFFLLHTSSTLCLFSPLLLSSSLSLLPPLLLLLPLSFSRVRTSTWLDSIGKILLKSECQSRRVEITNSASDISFLIIKDFPPRVIEKILFSFLVLNWTSAKNQVLCLLQIVIWRTWFKHQSCQHDKQSRVIYRLQSDIVGETPIKLEWQPHKRTKHVPKSNLT